MDDRMIELETKIAFQDELLDKLNTVIIKQQQQIERLEVQMTNLKGLVEESMPQLAIDDRPPHY